MTLKQGDDSSRREACALGQPHPPPVVAAHRGRERPRHGLTSPHAMEPMEPHRLLRPASKSAPHGRARPTPSRAPPSLMFMPPRFVVPAIALVHQHAGNRLRLHCGEHAPRAPQAPHRCRRSGQSQDFVNPLHSSCHVDVPDDIPYFRSQRRIFPSFAPRVDGLFCRFALRPECSDSSGQYVRRLAAALRRITAAHHLRPAAPRATGPTVNVSRAPPGAARRSPQLPPSRCTSNPSGTRTAMMSMVSSSRRL